MKITFLGTSHGFAEKGRFTSATLIEAGEHSYLLDAGGPVEALMVNRDKSFSDIRGIFITHMHNDHVGGLSTVIGPFLRYRFNDQSVCFFPEESGAESFISWLGAMHCSEEAVRKTVRFEVTKPGLIFENEDVSVRAMPTNHLDHGKYPAFSYLFEADGRRVLFTGDMSGGFPEYPAIIGDLHYDLIVCEMAHADLKKVAEMLKKSNTDRMLITHYHIPRISGYEEIFPTFPFDIQLARDGLEIII